MDYFAWDRILAGIVVGMLVLLVTSSATTAYSFISGANSNDSRQGGHINGIGSGKLEIICPSQVSHI